MPTSRRTLGIAARAERDFGARDRPPSCAPRAARPMAALGGFQDHAAGGDDGASVYTETFGKSVCTQPTRLPASSRGRVEQTANIGAATIWNKAATRRGREGRPGEMGSRQMDGVGGTAQCLCRNRHHSPATWRRGWDSADGSILQGLGRADRRVKSRLHANSSISLAHVKQSLGGAMRQGRHLCARLPRSRSSDHHAPAWRRLTPTAGRFSAKRRSHILPGLRSHCKRPETKMVFFKPTDRDVHAGKDGSPNAQTRSAARHNGRLSIRACTHYSTSPPRDRRDGRRWCGK